MASNVFGAKQFKPTAPDKGSFPLDHEGECRVPYLQYMVGERLTLVLGAILSNNYYCQVCLSENNHKNSECRQQSKDYLQCRMDRGLMAKEDWSKLGFREAKAEIKTSEAAS